MGLVPLGTIYVVSNPKASAGEESRNCKHPRPSILKGQLRIPSPISVRLAQPRWSTLRSRYPKGRNCAIIREVRYLTVTDDLRIAI